MTYAQPLSQPIAFTRSSTRQRLRSLTTSLAIAFTLLLLAAFTTQARAASTFAVQAAHAVLDNRENASTIVSYVHFGTDFRGFKDLDEQRDVLNNNGNVLPGYFTLNYRYYWSDDGVTDIEFFCNPSGKIYSSNIRHTNAEGAVPYLWANLSIQVLGHTLIESNKDNMTEEDIREAHRLVNKADARGLMHLWLYLQ